MESYKLSNEQQSIIDTFLTTDDNILVIGKAGVGKSLTLRVLQEKASQSGRRGIVCAPTGVAAINVGGITMHKLIATIRNMSGEDTTPFDYVIVDEVSMVRADLLDKLDQALKSYRRSSEPFGGMQVVMIGDPGQLPPVLDNNSAEGAYIKDTYLSPYFFSAAVFFKAKWRVIELTKIFRQSGSTGEQYIKLLNMVRAGENIKTVQALNEYFVTDEIDGIVLCSSNKQAAAINDIQLAELETPLQSFEASYTGDFEENEYPAPGRLDLKIGARVMVIKNIYTEDDVVPELVNGDWCEVVDFEDHFREEISQDFLELDSTFEQDKTTAIVVKCDRTGNTHLIFPTVWNKEALIYDKESKSLTSQVVGQFTQYPLRLAWAITIHKSQGATLDTFTIDMTKKMFVPGQLYVALSRGTNLEGLNIIGRVRKSDIRICPIISAFLKDFSTGVGIKPGSRFDIKTSAEVFKDYGERKSFKPGMAIDDLI